MSENPVSVETAVTYDSVMETSPAPKPLTAADRCDRCGAQAYFRAQRESMELIFCAHHTTEQRVGLETKGWVLVNA